jgi:hypothetical protein
MLAIVLEGSVSKLKCLLNHFRCPKLSSVHQAPESADIYSQCKVGMQCIFQYYDDWVTSCYIVDVSNVGLSFFFQLSSANPKV